MEIQNVCGIHLSDIQSLPDNRLSTFTQAIVRNILSYNHISATALSTAWVLRRLFGRNADDGAARSVSQTEFTSFPCCSVRETDETDESSVSHLSNELINNDLMVKSESAEIVGVAFLNPTLLLSDDRFCLDSE